MAVSIHPTRKALLQKLLDAHERSVSYARPAPWPRDVILKMDARAFPEAFAPDGREHRADLFAAARELEKEGCLRIVSHLRGPLHGEPAEIRLGPEAVPHAYEAAQRLGYEPLATGLRQVEHRARELAADPGPGWMGAFLERLVSGTTHGDLSALGMTRERFKREWRDLLPALAASVALARGIAPAWERMVSERVLGDSKLLGRVRSLVAMILMRADPRWEGVSPEDSEDPLETYGVRRKPGLIRCAGVAALRVGASCWRLEDFVPVAHLPESWSAAWIEGIHEAQTKIVTTIENEYPFLAYVEEAGGPVALGKRREVVVYTAGFPAPGLIATLERLGRSREITFRHWGDADVGGIRIWWLLRSRIGRPVGLFRTTASWLVEASRRESRQLSKIERGALARLRVELGAHEGDDVVAVRELIDTLLDLGVKLEQERY